MAHKVSLKKHRLREYVVFWKNIRNSTLPRCIAYNKTMRNNIKPGESRRMIIYDVMIMRQKAKNITRDLRKVRKKKKSLKPLQLFLQYRVCVKASSKASFCCPYFLFLVIPRRIRFILFILIYLSQIIIPKKCIILGESYSRDRWTKEQRLISMRDFEDGFHDNLKF